MKSGITHCLSLGVCWSLTTTALLAVPPWLHAASSKEKTAEKAEKADRSEKLEKYDKGVLSIELKGLLVPFDTGNLSARSTGVITTMKKEGDVVRKGDVVVNLEDDLERLAVDAEQSVYDKRKFEAESAEKLGTKGGISDDALRTARTNLKTADIQLRQAKVAQEHKTVVAPFDGVVTRRIRNPGEGVDQYNMQLITMVGLSKVYLETYLPANRLKDVQSGQPVEVRVADLPGRTYTGAVDFIAPVIDPASGEFRMKILIPNEDRSLRSGMSAAGTLALAATNSDAIPGPAAAQ